ncbi:alpha/beta hydrolase [Pelagibacterium montanilacus]|uniref:alpha/beta hydrolase n=1 Tax=Pelagibacterium montanilacus TaxID=2185280 RepID=UPI000F8F0D93|nr:alpha/beta hydrolase [Pelagibacterium montanilacus]
MVRKILFGTIAVVIIAYIALVGLLYVNQRALFYAQDGRIYEISETALERARLVSIPTGEGDALGGWYSPPQDTMATIVYYRGNAGSVTAEYPRLEAFAAEGYGFLAVDYRGFPLSPGEISEQSILEDALAAYDWAAEQGGPLLIWGRSLGASPAIHVASQRQSAALLLETPFYSAVSVAQERYPFVPVSLLMLDQFRSHEWIADVEEPVFVAHGTADKVVSVANGERLFSEVPNPYDLWIVEGAGHADLWAAGIWARAQEFFGSALEGT